MHLYKEAENVVQLQPARPSILNQINLSTHSQQLLIRTTRNWSSCNTFISPHTMPAQRSLQKYLQVKIPELPRMAIYPGTTTTSCKLSRISKLCNMWAHQDSLVTCLLLLLVNQYSPVMRLSLLFNIRQLIPELKHLLEGLTARS